jgi:hypothetical protein
MRLLACCLVLTTGCAAILRPSSRDITLHGPEEMRVLDNGRDLHARQTGPGQYSAEVSKDTHGLTVEANGVQATVPLSSHVSTGWLIADLFFFLWPALIDVLAGQLTSFDDADANVPLQMATAARGAPAQMAAAAVPTRAPAPPPPPRQRGLVVSAGKLAVLDFKNSAKDLQSDEVRYFTDVVRGACLKTSPGLEVMTRENLITLLQATGKDLGQCEGECEVDTGRRIGADAIISGDVLKVGSKYHISLRLHETHDGRLLSSAIATGKTVDELDETLQAAASDLLTPPR